MKKIIAFFISALLLFSFTACGENNKTTTFPSTSNSTTEKSTTSSPSKDNLAFDEIPDNMTSDDGKYEIAFVTDSGSLKDESFNHGTWNAVKKFAYENNLSYKYYQPSNKNQATDDDRYEAIKTAAQSGAEIIVCAGILQKNALQKAAEENTDIRFIFVDGEVVFEGGDETASPLRNVAAINFHEEESGYLAGYAAVMNGYTKLGFSGGGGGTNPSVARYGYGFIQGINDAAKEKNITADVRYSWEYGSSYSQSAELQTMLSGWYASGTQVIFCCGGSMCLSAFAAASANDGLVIGVDTDQSGSSDTVITSATKNVTKAVLYTLDKTSDEEWSEVSGKLTTLGAEEEAIGLPTESWKMENFSLEEYKDLYEKLSDGEINIDRDYENGLRNENFENVNLNII